MAFSPIIERELRRAARNERTYLLRLLVGGLASLSAIWPFVWSQLTLAETGWVFFVVLASLGMGYALSAGMFVTADALSDERRSGTLALLLSTPLRAHEVVVGKLLATSLHTVFGLLPAVPILGLTMFWGGVSAGEYGRVALVVLNTLFFSLSLGMFVSSLHRESGKAVLASGGIMGLLAVAPVALQAWAGTIARPIAPLSPLLGFYLSFDVTYASGSAQFWDSLIRIHLGAWLALAGASVVVSRIRGRPVIYASKMGSKAAGRSRERLRMVRLLDRVAHPLGLFVGWHDRGSALGRIGWVLAVGGCLWVLTRLFDKRWLGGAVDEVLVSLLVLQTWISAWIGWEAVHRLHEARQTGELELLLVTPLSVQQILHANVVLLTRRFFWPVMLVVVAGGALVISYIRQQGRIWDDELFWFVTFCLAGLILIESWAMVWVGLWQGITARRAAGAFSTTLFLLLILPWLEFLVVGPFLSFLMSAKPNWPLITVTWFACRYFNSFFWTGWAAHRCYEGFRERAALWAAR